MNTKNFTNLSRRNLLATLGIGAGATLFPSLSRTADAAVVAPKRFLLFYTYQGTLPQFWVPTGGNETSFTLNSLMQPYAAFQKDIVLLDGLDFKSAGVVDNPGNAHQEGQNHALCAIKPVSAELAGGPSIDQVIARGLPVKTRFPSLQLGVQDDGNPTSISYSGPGQQLHSEGNPTTVWNNVFKGFTPSGGGATPVVNKPDPEKAKQKSIIDFAKNEIAAVRPRMSSLDAKRLDNHLSAVRDLENQLALTAPGMAAAGSGAQAVSCAALPQQSAKDFAQYVDAHIKITQMAFACDLTRVISLDIDELYNTSQYTPNAFGTNDPHDLVHKTSPDNGELRGNPAAVEMIRQYHLEYARVFNQLLTGLANTIDVDGKRVLDNTVVLWAGQIALGSHSLDDHKWILAGGAAGALRTGRWLKCNHVSHQNMFVSLANMMDVNITTFGDPRTCTGKLAGL